MVKTGAERSTKYGEKFDAEVVRLRFTAVADSSKAKQVALQEQLAVKSAAVRSILNTAGIYAVMSVLYHSFNNRLFAICRKFAGLGGTPTLSATATAEATIDIAKWKDYGGTDVILQDIWTLYADMLGSAPSPVP